MRRYVYGVHVWDRGQQGPITTVRTDLPTAAKDAQAASKDPHSNGRRASVTRWELDVTDSRVVLLEFVNGELRHDRRGKIA